MDEAAKKTALRGITYGLYVVGTNENDEVNAFTGNWLTQTSFHPPLVALAVKEGTGPREAIEKSGVFAVSVLEAGQKNIATQFFKPVQRVGNKFGELEFELAPETGCPVLKDGLSWFECKVRDSVGGGDHRIYVAEVVGAGVYREGSPLTMAETGFYYGG